MVDPLGLEILLLSSLQSQTHAKENELEYQARAVILVRYQSNNLITFHFPWYEIQNQIKYLRSDGSFMWLPSILQTLREQREVQGGRDTYRAIPQRGDVIPPIINNFNVNNLLF